MIHSSGLTAGSWKMSGGGTFGKSKTKVWFDIDCENSSKLLYEIQVDFSSQTNRDPRPCQWVLVYLWWMKKVQFSPGFPSVHRKLRWKEDARCTSWLLLRKSPIWPRLAKKTCHSLSLYFMNTMECVWYQYSRHPTAISPGSCQERTADSPSRKEFHKPAGVLTQHWEDGHNKTLHVTLLKSL